MIENAQMSDAANALRDVLRAWTHGNDASVRMLDGGKVASFVAMVERNRLDALMWVALPDGALRLVLAGHLAQWRRSYEQSLIRNMQQQRLALDVCRCLEEAGIPCIGLRGPFAGDAFYGDVALRHFTDVDLLIPVECRDQAWEILAGQGYRFNHPFLTRSACTRHHLEWPFCHPENGLSLDLHWAVDHPYKLYRIDYAEIFRASTVCRHEGGTWRSPCRTHAMLLTCLHAEKECRLLGRRPVAAQLEAHGAEGRWRHWLDVALEAVGAAPGLDWNAVLADAEAWGVKAPVVAVLTAAATLFDVRMPSSVWQVTEGLQLSARSGRMVARIQGACGGPSRLGFRAECLFDVWRFLFPAKDHFTCASARDGMCRRVAHTLRAGCRLVSGALEWVWLKGRQVGRDLFNRRRVAAVIVLAVAMVGGRVAAHDFGDDVSDGPSDAEELFVNGGAITRVLEIDRDEDWFTFSAEPGINYIVEVSNVTLFDSSLDLYAGASGTAIASTNTLPYSLDATLAWEHSGILTQAYVRVSGMFEFTTGTYQIAVSQAGIGPVIVLGDAVDAPELTWTADGYDHWIRQVLTTYDGVDAVQSAPISHNQQIWMETTVSGPGMISFWWKVSSETNADFMSFSANGVEQPGRISGESGWQKQEYHIDAGEWTLRWYYTKDGAVSSGLDGGWVDQVVWKRTSVANDFDGDFRSDLGVYFPPLGKWYIFASTDGFFVDQFGYEGTKPITGDFDGDGKGDFGVYYAPLGKWYIFSSTKGFYEDQFGYAGTIPITGDFDGDGLCDFGCYHPPSGNWYLFQSTSGFYQTQFGFADTIPVTGDFDGDGLCDFGYYHPLTGAWKLSKSTGGFIETSFGFANTVPITGDFDADGIDDFGVYYAQEGKWYIFRSRLGYFEDQFGYAGTVPVVGDFDGDGTADIGCYFAPGGNWYIFGSSTGFYAEQFGYNGTLPLGSTQIQP